MARRSTRTAEYDPRTTEENIIETPLSEEMRNSFLEYAYSVIYARALPDARDGMKPVQRRIIYQMGQMNLAPDRPYMKSARVVGEVMGKLHPHGDSAIYEAMVRLAQPFAMRVPLVDGHGNFGSPDDGPAASRYTEARLAAPAADMIDSIHEDTVDFVPNYDNKLKEPSVLPSAVPNLLINGASGIAVGMATNMITHNPGETVAAAKYLMSRPDASVEELMKYIPGPDLPGGAIIMGRDGIKDAYEKGRGSFVTRAVARIENVTARKKAIIVTELPFMAGPEKVLEKISDGVKNKKLEGISSAVDLSDRHNGLKIVIEIKSGFDPHAVLSQLFKYTPLEESFTINNVALVNGRPKTMGLRELLQVWIDHRREVIARRSRFRKNKALERLHLVEGLLTALLDIDEAIKVIRMSENAEEAKTRLMNAFELDEIQARYILDLQLRRLTRISRIELESERDELKEKIELLDKILGSSEMLDSVVVQSMEEAVKQWNSPRRTIILDRTEDSGFAQVNALNANTETNADSGDSILNSDARNSADPAENFSGAYRSDILQTALQTAGTKTASKAAAAEGLKIEDVPCAVIFSADGLIARTSPQAVQLWNSRTADGPRTSHDCIVSIISTTTMSDCALITTAGRLVTVRVSDLPDIALNETADAGQGVKADELLAYTESTEPVENERTVAVISLTDDTPVAMGTKFGVVKRWNRESPTTMDSWPIMSLKDGDEILFAANAADADRLVFIASNSSLLTYDARNVRPQGRTASGMAGMKLNENSEAISFAVIPEDKVKWKEQRGENGELISAEGAAVVTIAGNSDLLEETEPGTAKVTPLELYPVKSRATGGVRSQRFLKGQNRLLKAYVGLWPVRASSRSGQKIELPEISEKRDGSGTELSMTIKYLA